VVRDGVKIAREVERLTAVKARNAHPGIYPDGGNLYLQVVKGSSRSWIFRYGTNGTTPIAPIEKWDLARLRVACRRAVEGQGGHVQGNVSGDMREQREGGKLNALGI